MFRLMLSKMISLSNKVDLYDFRFVEHDSVFKPNTFLPLNANSIVNMSNLSIYSQLKRDFPCMNMKLIILDKPMFLEKIIFHIFIPDKVDQIIFENRLSIELFIYFRFYYHHQLLLYQHHQILLLEVKKVNKLKIYSITIFSFWRCWFCWIHGMDTRYWICAWLCLYKNDEMIMLLEHVSSKKFLMIFFLI